MISYNAALDDAHANGKPPSTAPGWLTIVTPIDRRMTSSRTCETRFGMGNVGSETRQKVTASPPTPHKIRPRIYILGETDACFGYEVLLVFDSEFEVPFL